MKSFEETIKRRIMIQTIKAAIIGAFVVIAFIVKTRLPSINDSAHFIDSGIRNFVDTSILVGFFYGGVVMPIIGILNYRKALKTPEALEELHIKEADERNKMLTLKTCRTTLNLTCTLLGFAGILASFFSLTVLLTIGITLIAIVLLYAIIKVYYSKKY